MILDLDRTVGLEAVGELSLWRGRRSVSPGERLRYDIKPHAVDGAADTRYAATFVAVEVRFGNGTTSTELGLRDQHGVSADARGQGASKTLIVEQWNRKSIDLSAASGKEIVDIVLRSASPHEGVGLTVEVRDVRIESVPTRPRRPIDHVVTTRGSDSSPEYSRGNTFPAVGLPHGFVLASPVTNRDDASWFYTWNAAETSAGGARRPSLEAFALTHSPTPWLGDHNTLHFFPASSVDGSVPAWRPATFDRASEVAGPHAYDVSFDDGTAARVTTAMHTVAARFSYPEGQARHWIHIGVTDDGGSIGATRAADVVELTGYTANRSAEHPSATRMFFSIRFSAPVVESVECRDAAGRASVAVGFPADADAGDSVEMFVSTSFISLDQARENGRRDSLAGETVDAFVDRSRQRWEALLDRVRIPEASDDQLTSFYSSLYRVLLYPSVAHERIAHDGRDVDAYASPLGLPRREHTPTETGSDIVHGRLSANHGFWDTYRTAWPLLLLLDPDGAEELLDGFVQQYRDGGWIARWSSPGYTDAMVGTSSDAVLADAARAGALGDFREEAYDAGVKNATVPSGDPRVGRKGLASAPFIGYVSTETHEGLSWTFENCVNDFALASFSEVLARDVSDPRHEEYAANAAYFRARALHYRNLYDHGAGFFRGRDRAGAQRAGDDFDPLVWGGDYAETNAWGMAFSAPHDPAGLTALHGGSDALEAKLDEYFTTPEPASDANRGTYPFVIHEMKEAREIRLGSWGVSNQPAHHVPYLYLHTRSPFKTQAITREAVRRLFLHSEVGGGCPGDEDNGEMSAWYIFAALGLYPLVPGSGEYAITAPLFERVEIDLPSGATLLITARNQSPSNVYIQSLSIDGARWESPFVSAELVARGAHLDFVLGPEPSRWASSWTGPAGRSDRGADALRDVSPTAAVTSADGRHEIVLDDDSTTSISVPPGWWLEWDLGEPAVIGMYTVTLPAAGTRGWSLEASDDRSRWVPIDVRDGETFRWDGQLRPFVVAEPASHRWYRFVDGPTGGGLSQLELLL